LAVSAASLAALKRTSRASRRVEARASSSSKANTSAAVTQALEINSTAWSDQPANARALSREMLTANGMFGSARIATMRRRPSTGLSISMVPAMALARTLVKGGRSAKLLPIAASTCGKRAITMPSRRCSAIALPAPSSTPR
jgi:hypothetical protein